MTFDKPVYLARSSTLLHANYSLVSMTYHIVSRASYTLYQTFVFLVKRLHFVVKAALSRRTKTWRNKDH